MTVPLFGFDRDRFARDVDAYRRRQGLTLAALAAAARIDTSTLTALLSARYGGTSARTVHRLADVCDLDVRDYLPAPPPAPAVEVSAELVASLVRRVDALERKVDALERAEADALAILARGVVWA